MFTGAVNLVINTVKNVVRWVMDEKIFLGFFSNMLATSARAWPVSLEDEMQKNIFLNCIFIVILILFRSIFISVFSKRRSTGMQCCNKPCNVCPYVLKTKTFTAHSNNKTHKIKGHFTCATSGVVYLISCLKCRKQYIGQTGRRFNQRMMEHLLSIKYKKSTMGIHYSSPNHNRYDFNVQVIEKVSPNTVNYRREREKYWIKTLGTKTPLGLNQQN
jgi:hypothetical protein